ncbi:MAG TPA: hypothetical protein VK858_20280 [Longimicrobiales bacterium]|nr:hypothetical protein [Longimicrobiales bacterium]
MSTQFRFTRLALAVAGTTTLWACSDGDTATSVIDNAPPTAEAKPGPVIAAADPADVFNVTEATGPNSFAFVQGGLFQNIDPTGSTGTGNIKPFSQQAPGGSADNSASVNTSGKPKPYDLGSSANFNRDLLLSEVPQVDCDGNPGGPICREFIVDINEVDSGTEGLLSLDSWIVFLHDQPGFSKNDIDEIEFALDPCSSAAWNGSPPSLCTVVYDLDGNIVDDGSGARDVALMLNYSLNSGSGDGDNRNLIPDFGPDDCDYGDASCTTYLSVFVEYGLTPGTGAYDGGGTSSDGFEENTVRSLPVLVIEKTVTTTAQPAYEWSVTKDVTPASWALFTGETGVSDYTVTATKTLTGYTNYSASGDIIITNTGDQVAPIIALIDAGYAITCPGGNPSEGSPVVLDPGESITCAWESGPLTDDTDFENTAEATVDDPDFEGIQANQVFQSNTVTWNTTDAPDEVSGDAVNGTATLDDTWDGTGAPNNEDLTDTQVFNYSRTFACDEDQGDNPNTATLVDALGNEYTDDELVTVSCYTPSVAKTTVETFRRTWTWDIDKNADQTSLTLQPQQTFLINYWVDVNTTGYTDDNYRVTGVITISNPHPTRAAELTDVTDELDGVQYDPDCSGVTEVPAGGSIDCSYDTGNLASMPTGPNEATATQQLYDFASDGTATADGTVDYSGSEAVVFPADPTSEVDECIDVDDTLGGFLGTVCADAAPKQFTYDYTAGPFTAEACGQAFIDNTATFTTNDQGLTGEALWQVVIDIPCPSCTLTQGYWKTHNVAFWGGAPNDPTWDLVGGPNAVFFDSDDGGVNQNLPAGIDDGSYIDAMWTPPAGNMYFQLARQYIAAELNSLAFGSLGSYQDTFDDATDFLNLYSQEDVAGDSNLNSMAQSLASILDEYNNSGDEAGACDLDPISVSQIATATN